MAKLAPHPKAYLIDTRNVRQGLIARTKILQILENKEATAMMLVKEAKLSYSVVFHHLHLLKDEKVVSRNENKKPYLWKLTGIGQRRLTTI